ncbi:P27 family phage terminase small subunit [Chromobacterium alkanivorans]|uniref:P27 family phage terminase small subunit n=1 Tax=Chromobacterium alkanivorans TaxID=1071719 RepID=UPI0019686C53|nr:P27 family phage terminase small subunit [Chromobacterium alkanivorans]MBN3004503.1 P27 family phage terminase small subunit [Chromobacterium alkanivorans]
MSDTRPPFTVIHGGTVPPSQNGVDKQTDIKSPPPPPGCDLSPRERKVWDYICKNLSAAGLEHLTCGLTISVICRTYVRWIDAERKLAEVEEKNGGTYFVSTPNGYEQPHQAFHVARNLKGELLKWLPESCLTLPSVVTAKAKLPDLTPQDDLFDSAVNHARGHPSAASG